MARTVWSAAADIAAFRHGCEAAGQGKPRVPLRRYITYNERAAFNDGWDSVVRPKAKRGGKYGATGSVLGGRPGPLR